MKTCIVNNQFGCRYTGVLNMNQLCCCVQECPYVAEKTSEKPIIYHINDPDFTLPPKKNGKYLGAEWLWGNVITNKANRSDKNFAKWIEPDGSVQHGITREGFHRFFAKQFEHVYINRVTDDQMKEVCKLVCDMNVEQLTLVQQLTKRVFKIKF